MGHNEICVMLLEGVLFFTLWNPSCTATPTPQDQPLVRNSDRSVYARRSFALPDVVSDVYEVYVGPSVLRVSEHNIIKLTDTENFHCT